MYDSVREFVDRLGGYREVSGQLSMRPTTLHTHITNGVLPARWYCVFCALADRAKIDPPKQELFSFEPLPSFLVEAA